MKLNELPLELTYQTTIQSRMEVLEYEIHIIRTQMLYVSIS